MRERISRKKAEMGRGRGCSGAEHQREVEATLEGGNELAGKQGMVQLEGLRDRLREQGPGERARANVDPLE